LFPGRNVQRAVAVEIGEEGNGPAVNIFVRILPWIFATTKRRAPDETPGRRFGTLSVDVVGELSG
jgi:hypothetical protein